MVKSETQLYKFGEFQIDAVKRVLLRAKTPVPLPSRAFDVLLALVEHNQYVIDKDELMRLVWGERIVEENNLTRHISTLRKVLDESPNDHRYIVTVPGRGYSFVVPVERAPAFVSSQHVDSSGQTQIGTASESVRLEGTAVRMQRGLWAAALVVILACGGLLGLNLVNTLSKPAALNSYRDWDVVRLTRTGSSTSVDISRDGKYVAYVNKESGLESIWILQLSTFARHQIVSPQKFAYFDLFFTPDNSALYFTRGEGPSPLISLYRIPLIGGAPKRLRGDIDSQVVLSPDGARLAFARRNSEGKSEFIIASAEGVEERVLTRRNLAFPAWSPGGEVIAFSVGDASSGGETMSIHEIRLDDGVEKEISPRKWTYASDKTWLPDGMGLILSARELGSGGSRLWLVDYPSGDARPLSNEFDSFKHPRLTADAKMMVAQQVASVSDIWSGPLADVAGAKKIGVWGAAGLSVAPDGRIVFASMQSGEDSKIWVMNADGTEQKQLTTNHDTDFSPIVSPDGRYIVFASNRSGNFEIWRMNPDGSDLLQLTKSNGANAPSLTPDGRWVIYLAASDSYLYKVPIEGGEPARVAGKAVGASAVSSDGKLVAYFAPGKNTWEIAVSALDDGSATRKFEIGSNSLNNSALKWTPDDQALLYSVSSDGVANIWMQPIDGSPSKQVTDFKADGMFRFDVSPDGKNLVTSRGGWKGDIVLIKNLR